MAPRASARNAVLGLAAITAATTAQAQTPPIEETITQGAQIDEAVERATRPGDPEAGDDQAIDGEAGVYVLRREDIFYVAGSAGFIYSDNPLRTDDDAGGSFAAEGSFSLGMRTRLANAVDFGLAANAQTTHYFEDFAPTNAVVSGNASLGLPIGDSPFYIGAAAFGGWNLDEDLRNPVRFHGAAANLSANFRVTENVIVQPVIAGTRLWTEIEENDSKTASARLGITYLRGAMSANLFGSVSRIWFDNFFEDVTFVARKDWQYDGGLTVSFRVIEGFLLTASARYTRRDSSFFLADYRSFEAGLVLSAVVRF